MYVHVHVHVNVCVYVDVDVDVNAAACVFVFVHVNVFVFAFAYLCLHITHTRMSVCMHFYKKETFVFYLTASVLRRSNSSMPAACLETSTTETFKF